MKNLRSLTLIVLASTGLLLFSCENSLVEDLPHDPNLRLRAIEGYAGEGEGVLLIGQPAGEVRGGQIHVELLSHIIITGNDCADCTFGAFVEASVIKVWYAQDPIDEPELINLNPYLLEGADQHGFELELQLSPSGDGLVNYQIELFDELGNSAVVNYEVE